MFSHVVAALMVQAAATQITPLCPGDGPCSPPPTIAETAEQVQQRIEQFKALEAQVYAPLDGKPSASACSTALQRATAAHQGGMAAIIQKLCQN